MEHKRRSCIGMSEHPHTTDYLSSATSMLAEAETQPNFAKALVHQLASA
jgi:hypothetical protein